MFDYAKLEESRIVEEIEIYKTYESIINAEDNLIERRVLARFIQFLRDGGIIQ